MNKTYLNHLDEPSKYSFPGISFNLVSISEIYNLNFASNRYLHTVFSENDGQICTREILIVFLVNVKIESGGEKRKKISKFFVDIEFEFGLTRSENQGIPDQGCCMCET